jgi:hypothetical protein
MRLSSTVQLRQEGGVMADPSLVVWPGLLGLAGPWSFWAFTNWCIAGHVDC